MKLISYLQNAKRGVAALNADGSAVALAFASMQSLIDGGATALCAARSASQDSGSLKLAPGYRILAPLPEPRRNVFCVGKNYRDHVKEVSRSGFGQEEIPEYPIIFTKATTAVIGPGDAIPAHRDPTNSVDYEGELAVVIGSGGRDIAAPDAVKAIFGYTIVNDVTARRVQKRHTQWLLGKSLDGFCPMGPVILTADEVADLGHLELTTTVNGELRQQARLTELIFDVPTLIATISRYITLLPGDVIATGTPAGVGIGFDPPRFLKTGDVVRVRVDPIGTLENPVA